MAHPIQQQWCVQIRKRFPEYFTKKRVLDVGSLDINGNNRHLFVNCEYVGLDVAPGKNVDVVSVAHRYDVPNESFDVVLSTNALEHDMYYPMTLQKMCAVLKREGLMFFSVAHSWHEHGTLRFAPSDSGTTQMSPEWGSYYKNLNEVDVRGALDLDDVFRAYQMGVQVNDLQFWGIKK